MDKKISYALVTLIALIGLWFRIAGIADNHSFWSDEAFVSSYARDIVAGRLSIAEALGPTAYQPLNVLITTVTFYVFGASEFTARIMYVMFSVVGIVVAYLLGTKLSNRAGGVLAAFLFAFSQLNLANATQAKPYTAIETLTLCFFYLIAVEKTIPKGKLHASLIAIASAATLFHYIGVLLWIPYIVFVLLTHASKQAIIITMIVIVCVLLLRIDRMASLLLIQENGKLVFLNNNITYLRELLWKNYAFITLPAFVALYALIRERKVVAISMAVWIGALIFLWTFRSPTHNVRYLVPLFGVLFVLFGTFWGLVEKHLFTKNAFICLLVALGIYAGGYKIVRKPAPYYTPNADLTADVQIADYRTAYSQLLKKYPQHDSYVIVNNVIDSQRWYLNGRVPDATFVKTSAWDVEYGKSAIHPLTNKPVYTSAKQLAGYIQHHPKGVIIIEDWESILPDEIKEYARKNLKRDITVLGLQQAQGDNWPIEIYSWGFNKQ